MPKLMFTVSMPMLQELLYLPKSVAIDRVQTNLDPRGPEGVTVIVSGKDLPRPTGTPSHVTVLACEPR